MLLDSISIWPCLPLIKLLRVKKFQLCQYSIVFVKKKVDRERKMKVLQVERGKIAYDLLRE